MLIFRPWLLVDDSVVRSFSLSGIKIIQICPIHSMPTYIGTTNSPLHSAWCHSVCFGLMFLCNIFTTLRNYKSDCWILESFFWILGYSDELLITRFPPGNHINTLRICKSHSQSVTVTVSLLVEQLTSSISSSTSSSSSSSSTSCRSGISREIKVFKKLLRNFEEWWGILRGFQGFWRFLRIIEGFSGELRVF